MAGDSAHICQACSLIGLLFTLNLGPGMDSVANFTPIKYSHILNWSSSCPTLIKYKVGGQD